MNNEELTKFRLEALEEHLRQIQLWQEEAQTSLSNAIIKLNELSENAAENKKTLKGIFVSVIVGVTMLMITTIVAKLT